MGVGKERVLSTRRGVNGSIEYQINIGDIAVEGWTYKMPSHVPRAGVELVNQTIEPDFMGIVHRDADRPTVKSTPDNMVDILGETVTAILPFLRPHPALAHAPDAETTFDVGENRNVHDYAPVIRRTEKYTPSEGFQ
jgi:hypothetical protein